MDPLSHISSAPAYLLLVIVAGSIIFDCRRDVRQLVSARNVFLLTIIAWYLLEACIVPDELQKYDQAEYVSALMCVAVSVLSFLIGYSTSRGGVFDGIFNRLAGVDSPRLMWTVFLLALFIGYLPLVVISNGNILAILEDAFVPKSRWSGQFQRGRYGGARDAFLELQMFLRAAIPLAAAIVVHVRQNSSRRFIAALFLFFAFARAFNSGTRSQVIEVFLPIAAAMYWRLSVPLKKQAILWGLPAIVVLGLIWSAASVVSRNEGEFDWEDAADAKYVGFEMFRELLFIRKAVPRLADHQYGHTYYVQIVNPIPRFLWPSKPVGDAGLELAALQGLLAADGEATLTVSPGLLGEMYWNFNIPGIVILSAFAGYLAKSWDRVRQMATKSILAFTVFAAGLAIIFVFGRSLNMNTLYGLMALFGLLVLLGRRKKTVRPLVANVR
jgi:oligosaccharide repeat unit polymerase